MNENGIPSLASLIAERDNVIREIERLTQYRDTLESKIAAVRVLRGEAMPMKTWEVIRLYFAENETGNIRQVYKFALARAWNTDARDREGAMRTAVGRMVETGELETVPNSRPRAYRQSVKVETPK